MPPIPGVIVIPGDIGFLNQFFSVMLMVGNVAPAGSNLVVSSSTAEIVLPPGDDRSSDPATIRCAMARTAQRRDAARAARRAAGRRTASSARRTTSRRSARARAATPNTSSKDAAKAATSSRWRSTGTLERPAGRPGADHAAARPARCSSAIPTFTLTFTHPEVVNAGEPYTLDVTVTNTSRVAGELRQRQPAIRATSAARRSSATRPATIESIPPGDSATVTFDLIAQVDRQGDRRDARFGRERRRPVRAEDVGRRARRAAVARFARAAEGSAARCRRALRDAAIGLLGKAWAVATAPAAALPKDVQRFSKQIVLDRAVEVAEAGFRVSLHEPLRRQRGAARDGLPRQQRIARLPQRIPQPDDLAFAQENFTRLRRAAPPVASAATLRRRRGRVLAPDARGARRRRRSTRELASRWSYRPAHLSALVSACGGAPGAVPPQRLDAQGRRVGGSDADGKVIKQIPFSDALTFALVRAAAPRARWPSSRLRGRRLHRAARPGRRRR